MKYIDEFRDKKLVKEAAARIAALMPREKINFMEVCGTHTQSFFRFGLKKLLPASLRLIAGPGCPVCVSTQGYIDQAVALAKDKKNIILTFGDMLRIPGSRFSLEEERAQGGNVRLVYSPLEALRMAQTDKEKRFIFLAVGFETTAPAVALTVSAARKAKLKNLFFLSSLKLIPPIMEYLAKDKALNLRGFLCPGHVSAVIGTRPYRRIAAKYGLNCSVAGFEPLDIMEGIYLLLRQLKKAKASVSNQYARVVTEAGNRRAQRIIREVFAVSSADWRGFGRVPSSGLRMRKEFSPFDAQKLIPRLPLASRPSSLNNCKCGDVLKGVIQPPQCPLFLRRCRPDKPLGPCMVSHEGACNAYYRYR